MNEQNSFDSAVTIVLLTALAYAAAFAYEGAYLSHFGVPLDFVSVDLRSLLLCLAALSGAGSVIIFINGILTLWPADLPRHIQLQAVRTALIVGMLLLGGFLLEADLAGWLFLGAIALALLLIEFVLPLVAFRDRPSYSERVRAAAEHDGKRANAMDFLVKGMGIRRFQWVVLFLLAVMLAAALGTRQARTASDYLVTDGCVVLRQQGENLFCARIASGKLTGEYAYVAMAGATVSLQRVGPLAKYKLPRR